MTNYLLVDFGSTYTKLTLVDIDKCEILAQTKNITTINEGIMVGYKSALKKLKEQFKKDIVFEKVLACSSAAGGLKMISIGLSRDLTVEAGKRAALGAGARILKTYSYELSERDLDEIESLNCDIILLSGGTNGGNYKNILFNAKKLSSRNLKIPIIVAGNENVREEIEEIFEKEKIEYYITENVMPKVNILNADPVRNIIREIFMNRIVQAKGIDTFRDYIDGIFLPTPAAVLKAAELLSKGTKDESGIGDLIVVDIGGATTDIHSVSKNKLKDIETRFEGLEEPFAKRTVEGDLGMRYSAISLYEAVGEEKLKSYLKIDSEIYTSCKIRSENIEMVPKSKEEYLFDEAMAKSAVELAIKRHSGRLRKEYSNGRYIYYQKGKNLRDVLTIIGTGGVIINSKNPKEILSAVENNEDSLILTPKTAKYFSDDYYILSAMGLLAMIKPKESIKIMKKYLKMEL